MIPWQIYADYLEDRMDSRLFRIAEPKIEPDTYAYVLDYNDFFGCGDVGHTNGDGIGCGSGNIYGYSWGNGIGSGYSYNCVQDDIDRAIN